MCLNGNTLRLLQTPRKAKKELVRFSSWSKCNFWNGKWRKTCAGKTRTHNLQYGLVPYQLGYQRGCAPLCFLWYLCCNCLLRLGVVIATATSWGWRQPSFKGDSPGLLKSENCGLYLFLSVCYSIKQTGQKLKAFLNEIFKWAHFQTTKSGGSGVISEHSEHEH